MFIISKRNFLIQRAGRDIYRIPKDYVGEIPDEVASHWLIQAAIASGTIATPQGTKDVQLDTADALANTKADELDIRSDVSETEVEQNEEKGKRTVKR